MASEWKIKANGALKPFWGIIFLPSTATKTRRSARFQVRVLNTARGLKQLPGLKKKLGNVRISLKLNSAFSTIGKATADKITAKLVGKTHAFAFA